MIPTTAPAAAMYSILKMPSSIMYIAKYSYCVCIATHTHMYSSMVIVYVYTYVAIHTY